YHLVPEAADRPLARVHFGLVLAAVLILTPGIALAIQQQTELPAKIGSALMLLSMVVFGWIVLREGRSLARA
ncbi:hypothetical protein AB9K41_00015, partial [Cribrihabitans sp. XS_ASV171]